MKKLILLSGLLAITLLITMACQKASTANQAVSNNGNKAVNQTNAVKNPTDEAPRISLEDAKKDFDAGNAIFVDTRAEAAYKNEHIKGSINLSSENFEAKYKELPTGKKIIESGREK